MKRRPPEAGCGEPHTASGGPIKRVPSRTLADRSHLIMPKPGRVSSILLGVCTKRPRSAVQDDLPHPRPLWQNGACPSGGGPVPALHELRVRRGASYPKAGAIGWLTPGPLGPFLPISFPGRRWGRLASCECQQSPTVPGTRPGTLHPCLRHGGEPSRRHRIRHVKTCHADPAISHPIIDVEAVR
jgi:hypothetical protein